MISVSRTTLNVSLIAPPFPTPFTIRGYQTAEDVRAFHAGDRTLLAEVEQWLDDSLPDQRSMPACDRFHGRLHVAIPDPADAVLFKLRWSDVILV